MYNNKIRLFLDAKHKGKFPGGYQQYDFARSFYADMSKAGLFDQYGDFCDHFCDYLHKDIDNGRIWAFRCDAS